MNRFRSILITVAIGYFVWTLGYRIWESTFNNFAIEEIGVNAAQMGLTHAIREVPGLLGFLAGFLALLLTEFHLAHLSLALMGVGILLTAGVHGFPALVAASLLMSTGFHFFMPANSSLVLMTVGQEEAPRVLGRLNSLSAAASVLGTLLIVGTLGRWGYRSLFGAAGIAVVACALLLLFFRTAPAPARRERRRAPLRRRYWLYYTLNVLFGSRRHIFTTFAVYLLIREYGVPAQVITLLYLINSLMGTYLNQFFGQVVARFGERSVLSVNFALLALIFMGYLWVPQMPALAATVLPIPAFRIGSWLLFPALSATPALLILLTLFVADNVLFGFSFALECYFQKIALDRGEITPNVALGQTFNHMAAVVIPVVGGLIWETVGPQYTFLAGILIALACLGLTQWMRVPRPALCPAPTTGS
ncbi:MAG: MFS transporter [Anaerolineae bacterium]|nr:MFS transporter [Anaerolineae bacterium]